jgi:choline dehydrogenase-like flavoprotein
MGGIVEARKYDYLVVGSGMGGATLALELTKSDRDVLVLERGAKEAKLGTFRDILRFGDCNAITQMPKKSKEGTILWRTFQGGGSTMVSCGNGVRALQSELAELGIDLEQDFLSVERDLDVGPIDEALLSDGSQAIAHAASELGIHFEPMPKFINAEKCDRCGHCVFGCTHGARWSALNYLDQIERSGAEVIYGVTVETVLSEHGRATGVTVSTQGGRSEVKADHVVLAAGGVGTPIILQKSGIKAGEGLFMDLFVDTYVSTHGLNLIHEPAMAMVNTQFHEDKGFILSPFANHSRGLRIAEAGLSGGSLSDKNLLGIMTKVTDQRAGKVFSDGSLSKPVTPLDREKLNEGSTLSREILIRAGGNPKSVTVTKVQGAHPGGTAAIGEVVDENLETSLSGLFCCDASVLPQAPGLPPMLTIGALAKYLARRLDD